MAYAELLGRSIGNRRRELALKEALTVAQDSASAARASLLRTEAASRARSHFLANMSHELRTPLNAIIGFSDVLRSQGGMDPTGRALLTNAAEYAGYINDAGNHLLSVINDILDAARLESGQIQIREDQVDCGALLSACEQTLAPMATKHGVSLAVQAAPFLPPILADEQRLRQALVNLGSNSLKHTPPGGQAALIAQMLEDGSMMFRVVDNGVGMRPEDIPRAMAPFQQVEADVKRKQEGAGLGLPLAKAFVELHGGTLRIDSAPGKGTCVTVRMPASRVRKAGG